VLLLDARLPCGPDAARRARERIATLDRKVSQRTLEDMTLLASELVTNAYRHAGLSEGDPIELRVSLKGSIVRIEVADPGNQARPHIRESAVEGGWGLRIVQELSARWGTDSDTKGTTVWLELESV
jgi:serine/threonine-protein kinase RsbW